MGGILVINPNSSEQISAQIRKAVSDFDSVTVVTSASGPSAIETDEDVLASIEPMLAVAVSRPSDAIVVACFSDPGLDRFRDCRVSNTSSSNGRQSPRCDLVDEDLPPPTPEVLGAARRV